MRNVRRFALVVFDLENRIIDRYNFNVITEPKGLGFKLKLSLIATDIEDIVTKAVQEKTNVTFKVNHTQQGYNSANILSEFIQKHTLDRLGIEYYDTTLLRYAEGRVVELRKEEKDEFNVLTQELVFQPTTPFFSNIENVIKIQYSEHGKAYPFKYPYAYGQTVVENNEINNNYINDVPLTIVINGSIAQPMIDLQDASGNMYARVSLPTVTINEGQYLIINTPEAKIWFWNGAEFIDYTNLTDPAFDTFLKARRGISHIFVNLQVTDTGSLTGSWRQYRL